MRKILGILSFILLLTILVACGGDDPVTYTVTFESNGGSAVTAITGVEKDATIAEPTAPTRNNYTFAGWYKEAALTNPWVFATDQVSANITLYAKWNEVVIPQTFTVTFQSNGGSSVAQLTGVENNALITEPTPPTRSGYTFGGWYKESSLTTLWNFNEDRVTSSIILYAKWDVVQLSDEDRVDAVYDWLTLPNLDDLTNDSPRIIMPVQNPNHPTVTIAWNISNTNVIQANGVIVQPDFETGDQSVTLTATITLNSVTREKVFTATVLALPSETEMPPLINETFESYPDGNILNHVGLWMPVSGKSGNSIFTVVSSITGMVIPEESKALKIEALQELQVEAPIAHAYDVLVVEVDLMQTASSNGSPVHIQSSSSAPVIGFGLNGTSLYYRVDNNSDMSEHAITVQTNEWYRLRMEIDLVNKTVQGFYYLDGQLMAISEPVTYTGTTSFQSLFIRSGSSTTAELRAPAYVTNIVVNRIESMPRPEEMVKLGEVTGIRSTVNQPVGEPFTPDTPVVNNYYGSQGLLVLDTDYTIHIDNPVDIDVADVYTVTYTITNTNDPLDVKVINQEVTIYSEAEPNEIISVTATPVDYFTSESTVTINIQRAEGMLYYLLSNNATETAEDIILNGQELPVSQTVIELVSMIIEYDYIHAVVVLNGNSNIMTHEFVDQVVNLITTKEEFYQMATTDTTQMYVLMNDLDFTGFQWNGTSAAFRGKLYGQGFTVSNITVNSVAQYGGIFSRINGAYIEGLVIDNFNITSTQRSGALAGRMENNKSVIKDIVVMNSTINGGGDNGVGGLIGQVNIATEIYNIAVINTSITANSRSIGGVVGRIENGSLHAEDIYVEDVAVTSLTTNTDMGAAAFLGRVSSGTSLTLHRIVVNGATVDGIYGGAVVGRIQNAGTIVTEGYFDVEFMNTERSGLVGRADTLDLWIADDASIYGILTNAIEHATTQPLTNSLAEVTVDDAWWIANLDELVSSDLWTLQNGMAYLNNYAIFLAEEFDVFLFYNVGDMDQTVVYRDGQVFDYIPAAIPGYEFAGWFTDPAMETALPENYIITEELMLWGKYETVPASTVTFVSNMNGVTVDGQLINYGELATEPTVDQMMHEDVLKYIAGWTLDGEPFDFNTPIIESITLEAVWSIVNYVVMFGSGDAVTVPYGQTVEEPLEAPVHPLYPDALVFVEWLFEGTPFDFNTPITQNVQLFESWVQENDILITTPEEFIAMTQSTSGYTFVLANDIDFTGVEWTQTGSGANFKGSLNGNHFTLDNVTITSDGYAGLFQRMTQSTIENLIINNASITSSGNRAGILVAEINGTDVVIQNIIITNSSVSGNSSNGVGGLVGYTKANFENSIENIYMNNTTVTNQNRVAGGLIGLTDGTIITINDINLINMTVTSTERSGGLYGEVKGASTALVNVNRIVIEADVYGGSYVSGIFGRPSVDGLIINLSDAVFSGSINATGSNVGHISGDRSVNANNVFMIDITVLGTLNKQNVATEHIIDSTVTTVDEAWWITNLPSITHAQAWEIVSGYAVLSYGHFIDAEDVTVTLVFGHGLDDLVIILKEGMTFKVEPAVIEGSDFDGWFTDQAFTHPVALNYQLSADITLYAKYVTLATFTVTFDTDEGSIIDPITGVIDGSTIDQPADPTKDGYSFLGWFKNELLTVPWDFETDIVTSDTMIYASWQLIEYTVTFESNEGSIVDAIENVLPGSTITAPTDPTRLGYTFVGWFSDELLTIEWDFIQDTVDENMTLYAKWDAASENTFTVIFDSNEGSNVDALTDVPEGATIMAPTDPTKDGYTFAGWFVDELFATAWDFDLDTVVEDMTLYAKWDEYIPLGTPITTPAEFIAAVSGGSSDTFYLANDLDFDGVEWNQTGTGSRFLGVIDGNYKTIENIAITSDGYAGIFQRTGNGAVIKNITIINSTVVSTGRAGMIAGRAEDGLFIIENVMLNNISVTGADSNGVGLVMGMASKDVIMKNVAVINSFVTSSQKNVALFIGRADQVVVFEDIFAKNSIVDSTVSASTDQGVSVFVGYTNNAAADITITRAVIDGVELRGRSIGSLVGYFRYGNLTVTDVLLALDYNYSGSDGLHGIIGRRNPDSNTTNPVLTNVFEYSVGMQIGGASVQLDPAFMIASYQDVDQTWWNTNLSVFTTHPLWRFESSYEWYVLF